MYKIFVNGVPIYVTQKLSDVGTETVSENEELITEDTSGKSIAALIESIKQNPVYKRVYLLHKNPKLLLKRIKKHFEPIEAAGGVVLNDNDELLMIFRRGKWDLPKGKSEGRESKRKTAIREVKEETGVKKIRVDGPIMLYASRQRCSYHAFVDNGKHYLKATYWFLMRSKSDAPLEPQVTEDIFQAEWVPRAEVNERLQNSYPLLQDVIAAALD